MRKAFDQVTFGPMNKVNGFCYGYGQTIFYCYISKSPKLSHEKKNYYKNENLTS